MIRKTYSQEELNNALSSLLPQIIEYQNKGKRFPLYKEVSIYALEKQIKGKHNNCDRCQHYIDQGKTYCGSCGVILPGTSADMIEKSAVMKYYKSKQLSDVIDILKKAQHNRGQKYNWVHPALWAVGKLISKHRYKGFVRRCTTCGNSPERYEDYCTDCGQRIER